MVGETGLTGKYDFTLVWSDENTVETADAGSLAPSIFTAVQEQLGLRLESTKGPVDMVVVDRVEMPSES